MGIIQHNAVLATTWDVKQYTKAYEWIRRLDLSSQKQFLIGVPLINGEVTIVLVPDGSKEGWNSSRDGDILRASFIQFLNEQKYDNGSSSWKWVEVAYGELGVQIIKTNQRNMYV